MNRSPSRTIRRARVLVSEGVRELSVDFDGNVATSGDGNRLDLDETALENLELVDSDQAVQDVAWQRELSRRRSYEGFTADLSLTAEEWDNVSGEYESEKSDEDEIENATDEVGEATYEDEYSQVAEATEALEGHELVRGFGFAIDSLITPRGNPMRADFLAVVVAGCKAADEIATLLNDREVAMVLGWQGEIPSKLSGFGVEILFRNAGILQGVVEAIKESRRPKVAPKATPAAKPAIVLPGRQSAPPRVMTPASELVKPVGSDPFGRVTTNSGLAFRCVCGCGGLILESVAQVPPIYAMRDRQNGNRVGSKDLWRHAFSEQCIARFGRGFSLKETMRKMLDEECKREAASRTMRPSRPEPACFGSSGKGAPAAQLAKKAERAEKDRQIRSNMQSAGKKR